MLRAASTRLCCKTRNELLEYAVDLASQNRCGLQHLHCSAQHAADAAAAGAAPVQDTTETAAEGKPGASDGAALGRLLQQQRVQHRAQLSKLRRQWGDQQAEFRQQKQLAAAKRAAAVAEAKAEAKRRRDAKQRADAKEEQLHLQEEAQERERLRGEAAKRRQATQAVYDMYREDRVQWLAEQSRNWIAPGELEERIEWALSHPQPLGSTASLLFAEEQQRQHRQTAKREKHDS